MTVDLKSPRPDLVYLRRRLKPGETLPERAVASATTTSLILGSSASETSSELPIANSADPYRFVPPVVCVSTETLLNENNPVVRFSRTTTAIGSLIVSNINYAAWETKDRKTGFLYATPTNMVSDEITGQETPAYPEIPTPKNGNRHLVEFVDGNLIIGLRHILNLKRLILRPNPGGSVVTNTISGLKIVVHPEPNQVIYMSMVDRHLETRLETYRENVQKTFNIGTPHKVR